MRAMHNTLYLSTVKLSSPAKINLTLDIMGMDYRSEKHFVNTILYRHDELFDEIELTPLRSLRPFSNVVECTDASVPTDSTNTLLRAFQVLQITGWHVKLHKRIPVGAGLGGGSSNAGVILKHFGRMKGIPEVELLKLAQQIGADVPFFVLDDNLAYCEGFGDEVIQSWSIPALPVEVIETGVEVSTKDAYASLDLETCGTSTTKTEALLSELQEMSQDSRVNIPDSLLHNDFESSFFAHHPELKGQGHLCGSGGMMWHLKPSD